LTAVDVSQNAAIVPGKVAEHSQKHDANSEILVPITEAKVKRRLKKSKGETHHNPEANRHQAEPSTEPPCDPDTQPKPVKASPAPIKASANQRLAYAQEIGAWIEQVRTSKLAGSDKNREDEWTIVSDAKIDAYLNEHPEIKRYRFQREVGLHPECKVIGRGEGVKVRVKP
jgi:hypothetical protein